MTASNRDLLARYHSDHLALSRAAVALANRTLEAVTAPTDAERLDVVASTLKDDLQACASSDMN